MSEASDRTAHIAANAAVLDEAVADPFLTDADLQGAIDALDAEEDSAIAAAILAAASSLNTHTALKKGVHGLPAAPTGGHGLLWDAGTETWLDADLATQAELDAEAASRAAADTALAGLYRTRFLTTGRATALSVTGTKWICAPGQSDQASGVLSPTGGQSAGIMLFRVKATDLALAGKTTKIRLTVIEENLTAPNIDITAGIYPVSIAASTITLGAVVAGSTVAFAAPGANNLEAKDSGDTDLPADGIYCVGYITSATPAASFVLQCRVEVRNV